jgi:hypothetical protein
MLHCWSLVHELDDAWQSAAEGLTNAGRARRHVIIETNKTTARIFPEVPDCETPQFWEHMEKLIVLNKCAQQAASLLLGAVRNADDRLPHLSSFCDTDRLPVLWAVLAVKAQSTDQRRVW